MIAGDGIPGESVWTDAQCEGCAMPNDGKWREEYNAWICDEHYVECERKSWVEEW